MLLFRMYVFKSKTSIVNSVQKLEVDIQEILYKIEVSFKYIYYCSSKINKKSNPSL